MMRLCLAETARKRITRPRQVFTRAASRQRGCTHHHDVARPVLDGAEEAEDDDDDVDEVGEDGGPLVAQEVKDLSLQSQQLKGERGGGGRKKTNVIRFICSGRKSALLL